MVNQKLMEKLLKLTGSLSAPSNPHTQILDTHSPSLNFTFGNNWGLPKGYTLLLYGQPKGGKSLISRSLIGKLHQSDPESVAVVFDTEARWELQLMSDEQQLQAYNIDKERLNIRPVNHPALIFDTIEKDLAALKQQGLKIDLLIIDSLTGVLGRRTTEQTTIMTQQRGDWALTVQEGLKQILPTIRQNKMGLIITTQIRDEQDAQEIMKKKKIKPAAPWAVKHFCEYAMYVEPIDSQAGRKTLGGAELVDENLVVFKKSGEQTGHRIRAKMTGSSGGPKNRVAEFTIDYDKGFINQYEEIFTMGVGMGVIEKPTAMSYVFGDRKWVGSKNIMEALNKEPELCEAVLKECKRRDLTGEYKGGGSLEDAGGEDETDVESGSDDE